MLLVLPIVLPLATAVTLQFLSHRPKLQRVVAFGGALAILATAVAILWRVAAQGIQVVQVASWPAPFGITLVADLFSALLVAMVGILGTVITAHSFSGVDPRREAFGYHALIHVLLMGVSGAFLTGDIFNLYVWFEVMLIASFVLMSLHRTRAQLHAAFTYVGLNLLASAFLLTAIGLLYGQAGTLNLADLARAWPDRRTPALDASIAMLFLTAFGIKAGLFPLFFWLPASYHTPPAAVGALLAGLLTKVGVYAMIRVFTLLFPDPAAGVYVLVLVLSVTTMVVGMLGAIGQADFRRVLSFNLVGHIGFTTVGLALWTPGALAGSIFYVLHHMLVITSLFLVSGLFLRQRRTTSLAALGGLYRSQPLDEALFRARRDSEGVADSMVRKRGCVDDERFAFPAANGMAVERRCRAVVIGDIEVDSTFRSVVLPGDRDHFVCRRDPLEVGDIHQKWGRLRDTFERGTHRALIVAVQRRRAG